MGRFARPLGALCLLAVFSGGPLPAQEPQEPQEPKEPPQAASASAQERRMPDLLRQAETWRGLPAKQPVKSRTLGEKQLAEFVVQAFREETPPEDLRVMEVALKAFGLIPESMDLGTYLPKLLTGEIAGFYDPEDKSMSLVLREGGILAGKEGEAGLGSLDNQRAEDMVLIHELVHALQDQHFDLAKFVKADVMSDGAAARQALAEGDATLTMLNALLGTRVEEMPNVDAYLAGSLSNPDLFMSGSEGLAGAPAILRESLLFSYLQGNLFCVSVRRAGGQKLLDYAFRQDPPLSTEQIFHPEKWHGKRDNPIELTWPDLSATLPGYQKASEGEMGELSMRILLREALKDAKSAETGAAGWGGDRFAVYEKDGRRLVAWITEWDSVEDAAQFRAAAKSLGEGWRVLDGDGAASSRRVLVLRGELPAEQLDALRERLEKAEARRPDNKSIDLGAFRAAKPV